ncbi:type II secretion system inner membrane protein GspF [Gammaproteobacteria bacterium]|nr:type II secretion system inner membrane protein GspF [Gammaproteobacteria bacterium]
MPTFHYQAINTTGNEEKGIIEADSLKHASHLLKNKNLTVLKVQIAQQKISSIKFKSFSKSLNVKEIALITRQFSTLLSAGLPIEEVLTAVAEQTEKTQAKSIILSVRSKVLGGISLASALREYPDAFSELYCSTVSAGEKSGHLDIVLLRLADYTEQQFQMRQKIQQALIYPSIMILVAIGIVGFLLEYVVPKMVSVYSNINQELPWMTKFLISFSNDIKQFGIYFLILLVLSIFLFKRTIKNNINFKKRMHRLYLKIPIIGNTIKIANTARFSRTFAILSSAGVSVLEAMSISAKLITNLSIHSAVVNAANRVREGATIYLALKQTGYFPPMSIHLIASGEASGQLENMLERSANNQDEEIKRLIDTTLTLFEPAIILVMGAVVLFIVLAILMPIFQLNEFNG